MRSLSSPIFRYNWARTNHLPDLGWRRFCKILLPLGPGTLAILFMERGPDMLTGPEPSSLAGDITSV